MYLKLTDLNSATQASTNVNSFTKFAKQHQEIAINVITEDSFYYVQITSDFDFSQETNVDSVVNKLPSQVTQEYIDGVLHGADDFGQEFMDIFRRENVLMGITQLGKTSDVLHVMSKKYELDPTNKPGVFISMMDVMLSGSLTLAAPLFDLVIAEVNSGTITLSPFITVARMEEKKQDVINYLTPAS